MKRSNGISAHICAGFMGLAALSAQAGTVADAKSAALDTQVTIDNVTIVNMIDTVQSDSSVSIQVEDTTGGITLFGLTADQVPALSGLQVGDVVSATGYTAEFNGLFELDGRFGGPDDGSGDQGQNPISYDDENTTATPTVTTIGIPDIQDNSTTAEALESRQVLLPGVTFDDGDGVLIFPFSANLNVSNADGTGTVRISTQNQKLVGTTPQVIPTAPVNVWGLVGQFDPDDSDGLDDGYQLIALDVESSQIGDTDYDGDTDNSDLLKAIGAFTGPTTPTGVIVGGDDLDGETVVDTPSWNDGNFDRDRDVDNSDLLAAIGAFTGPTAAVSASVAPTAADPGIADLIYNAADGSLTIDTSESSTGEIAGYVLQSDGAFQPGNFNAILAGTKTATDSELSEANPFGAVSGVLNLGQVLTDGLTEAQLQDTLTAAFYTGGLGVPEEDFDIVFIPEPASLTLMALGGWLVLGRRRRGS